MSTIDRLLVIPARPVEGGREEMRFYAPTPAQCELIESLIERSKLSPIGKGMPDAQIRRMVEQAAILCLLGRRPAIRETGRSELEELVRCFPPLDGSAWSALPRHGAPRGTIRAVVFEVKPPGQESRLVRIDFSPHQAERFSQVVRSLAMRYQVEHGFTPLDARDDAWQTAKRVVGRFLSGAAIVVEQPDPLAVQLGEVFGDMTPEQFAALPRATPEDMLTWDCRPSTVE